VTPSKDSGNENETPWILKESADMGEDYQDRLTFLGDSTTYGLLDRGILKDGQLSRQVWYGVTGHTITFKFHQTTSVSNVFGVTAPADGMLITEMAEKEKPEILVITLGVTGGVSYNMEEQLFKTIYDVLIADILNASPNTKIICNSIYPVCKVRDAGLDSDINNENISKTNGWIEELVKDRHQKGEAVYYLDSYSLLIDEDGYLPQSFSNGDGLHLSDVALNKVVEIMRTHPIPD
jgi:hypothetical protein